MKASGMKTTWREWASTSGVTEESTRANTVRTRSTASECIHGRTGGATKGTGTGASSTASASTSSKRTRSQSTDSGKTASGSSGSMKWRKLKPSQRVRSITRSISTTLTQKQ